MQTLPSDERLWDMLEPSNDMPKVLMQIWSFRHFNRRHQGYVNGGRTNNQQLSLVKSGLRDMFGSESHGTIALVELKLSV